MIYSPLRYPGGKTRAIKFLKEFIPENTKEICSPFFGGGSFEIYLMLNGVKVYAYDNLKPLVCFWQSILYDHDNLIKKIKQYGCVTKEKFSILQKQIHDEKYCTDIGAIFFILNRCSFSGTGVYGGMSIDTPRFTESSIRRLDFFNCSFNIECMDFSDSIRRHSCLVYADPPYLIDQKLYNNHTDFNHLLLCKILNDRGNFVLSYNNCEEIKDLYYKHKFIFPNWQYGMGNSKKSNEILIISKN